ncbi:MAG: DNA/RNA non-specific endonuclease [gamma proteobacterium symbiont of Clathrolucina costata]
MRTLTRIIITFLGLSLQVLANDGNCPSTPYILQTPPGYDHLRYAPIEKERLYDGGSFVASVDGADDDNGDGENDYLVEPNWVAYHLKSYRSPRGSNYAPAYKRPRDWYRIPLFDEERKYYRTNKSIDNSYDGVGRVWNRGHLAQRADANRLGEEYGCNTHVFANAVPQKASLNQGIWLALENYVSSLANQRGDVWIVAGPIFEQGHPIETIGDQGRKEIPVAIPDEIFKVVFMEQESGVEVLSFIYPNKYEQEPANYLSGNCQRDQRYDHTPYIVSLSDVERATGLTFFGDVDMDLSEFKAIRATGLPSIDPENAVGYCL